MKDTFVCAECRGSFPYRQMKETFVWEGRKRTRFELCPEDLDKWMQRGRVAGMAGIEKRAAVQITPGPAGKRQPIGSRGSGPS